MATVTKKDLVEEFYRYTRYDLKFSQKAIQAVLDSIIGAFAAGEKSVYLTGLGVFKIVKRKQKKGRNPATGEDLILPEREVLKFIPSPILLKKIKEEDKKKKGPIIVKDTGEFYEEVK